MSTADLQSNLAHLCERGRGAGDVLSYWPKVGVVMEPAPDDRSELLDQLLTEFCVDLRESDDYGLWELSWQAASRLGGDAKNFVAWARQSITELLNSGEVTLFATSWPEMNRKRPLTSLEYRTLEEHDDPWFDPGAASLIVLVGAGPFRDAQDQAAAAELS